MKRAFLLLLLCCCRVMVPAQEVLTDCYDTFFKTATKIKNTASVKLLVNKRPQTLAAYLKKNVEGLEKYTGLKDLDGDGKPELVVYNFTGGAHCCDEWYFFRQNSASQYELAAKLYAGNTCVTGNTFLFDFAETFGYFFTCYACELEEKKKAKGESFERLANISLKYKDGKLLIDAGDAVLKEKLLRNLRYIKALGWDGGAKGDEFDDGRRKALAQTLAVYHFSFGKKLNDTKALFNTYYPFKDAAAVWNQFAASLANLGRQNSF